MRINKNHLLPAAAVPIVAIGVDESTYASSPGGGTGDFKKSTARHRPWSKSGRGGIVDVAFDRWSFASATRRTPLPPHRRGGTSVGIRNEFAAATILERVAAQCRFELRLQNDNQPW